MSAGVKSKKQWKELGYTVKPEEEDKPSAMLVYVSGSQAVKMYSKHQVDEGNGMFFPKT